MYAFQGPGTPGITDGIKQVDMKKEAEDEYERPELKIKVEARDGTSSCLGVTLVASAPLISPCTWKSAVSILVISV